MRHVRGGCCLQCIWIARSQRHGERRARWCRSSRPRRQADLADRIEADPELAALSVFNFGAPPLPDEEIDRMIQQSREEDAAIKQTMASLDEMPDGPLDLDTFLKHAYARPLPAARIDAAFARADISALAASLAQLPADLPPLTAPMDGNGLARWLAFFRTEDEQCEALVFAVTRLDEGA